MRSILFCAALLSTSAMADVIKNYKEAGLGGKYVIQNLVSPKSASYSKDDSLIIINALEAGKTIAVDSESLKNIWTAEHCFSKQDDLLMRDMVKGFERYFDFPSNPEGWCGKPVEMALTKDGSKLYVSSYRKSFDQNGSMASSITILNALNGSRIGALPSGPIPKMVALSDNGKYLAVANWGDNTLSLWSINNNDHTLIAHVEVAKRLDKGSMVGDRDKNCGLCLRGTIFSPTSNYLLTARLSGEARIDAFDVSGDKAGWIKGPSGFPIRHMASDGKWLYTSSTSGALVARTKWDDLKNHLQTDHNPTWFVTKTGGATRTISVASGRAVAAVHGKSEMIVLDASDKSSVMQIIGRAKAPMYPVGAAISSDGMEVLTTAQGVNGVGGHKLGIWELKTQEELKKNTEVE